MAITSRRGAQIPPAPVAKMTNGKVALLVSFALLFDALKFMCTQLWFFGPALIGLAGSVALGGGWFGSIVGTVIGVGAAASVGAAIEALGIILSLIVGAFGWLIMFGLLIGMGVQPFGTRHFTPVLIGFLVGEMPFVNALPTFTVPVWQIIRSERKADTEARKKWAAENAEALKQQRMDRIQMKQALDQQAAQEEADEAAAEEQRTLQEQYDALGFQDTEDVAAQLAEEEGPKRRPLVDAPSL